MNWAELSYELGRVVSVRDFIGPSGLVRVVFGPSCPAPPSTRHPLNDLFQLNIMEESCRHKYVRLAYVSMTRVALNISYQKRALEGEWLRRLLYIALQLQ